MSQNDIYKQERARRYKSIADLTNGNIDVRAAIEQFNKLDESYKKEEQGFREDLECIYKETRHHTANWPVVYSFNQTGRHPFFNGETDDDCNPYYRISLVIAGSDDGIAPVLSPITRTGGAVVNRFRAYTDENPLRTAARTALANYPDRTVEDSPTGGSCAGETPPGSGVDPITCAANGGVWTPGYNTGDTAVEILQDALNPWRAEIVQLKADLCDADIATHQELQDIIDEVDDVLGLLPPIPTYPDQTPDPAGTCSNPFYTDEASCELNGHTWSSPLQDAIDNTVDYIDNEMVTTFDQRATDLTTKAEGLESKFFAIIGLRLHQINGSYAKLKQLKDQLKTNLGLIADHRKSIANINVLIVENGD